MTKQIVILIVGMVGGTLVLGVLASFTDGRLIELIGGARMEQVETVEQNLNGLRDSITAVDSRFDRLELLIVRGPFLGTPDRCPEGWIDNEVRFQDSNTTRPRGDGSQYRLCIRARRVE